MSNDRLIPLGIITAPHGIKGEVRIRSFTADPGDLTAYGTLTDKRGTNFNISLKSYTKDVIIASVKGITSREAAEALRNTELCVPRSALPEADGNEYYHEDLIGLALTTEKGEPYGTVTAVHNFGAGDIFAVKCVSGEEEFVPFSRANFPVINVKNAMGIIIPPVFVAADSQ